MKKLSYMSISMDETLKEKLKYLAEQEQRSLSSQVRHLIRLYFQEYVTKYRPIEAEAAVTQRWPSQSVDKPGNPGKREGR